ncbi:hypothetical protein [Paraburkholderia kururiensis]|uniref:hypothetical protein n=1 Tax=Paraburkholderia kururiensis TaxID=984307 RepID=UPI0018F4E0DF|nr:hypothetical protein [Paraburkholderia kururiensis]
MPTRIGLESDIDLSFGALGKRLDQKHKNTRQTQVDPQFPFDVPDRNPFEATPVQRLRQVLKKYSKKQALAAVSGLMTLPQFQANCYRLEVLAHLVVASCEGQNTVLPKNVLNWLNRQLGSHPVATMEDPPEDAFVMNVLSKRGEFLILGGYWEMPDAATSLMLEILEGASDELEQNYLEPAYALLRLSDLILRRAGLKRWTFEPSQPKQPFPESVTKQWKNTITRAKISVMELEEAGISLVQLEPFMFRSEDEADLVVGDFSESWLQRRPLTRFGDDIVIAIPGAVSYAVRRFLLTELSSSGKLELFEQALHAIAMARAATLLHTGARHDLEYLKLPAETEDAGALGRSLVFRLGQNRYIHLLLLGDSLERNVQVGMLDANRYKQHELDSIAGHISEIRRRIEEQHVVDSAHTIALFGHLGQSVMVNLPAPPPKWTIELCRLHDLEFIMLDRPGGLDKLVLLFCQHRELQQQGFEFANPSGLLNLYAYWLERNCYLLHPTMPKGEPAFVQLGSDHLTSFRLRLRRSTDRHCELSVSGDWEAVTHANHAAIYPVLRSLPAYLSVRRMRNSLRSFCIIVPGTAVWITALTRNSLEWAEHIAGRIWEDLQLPTFNALVKVAPSVRFRVPAVELILDFQNIEPIDVARDMSASDAEYRIQRHQTMPVVRVTAGPAVLQTFSGVGNDGEQMLLAVVLAGLQEYQPATEIDTMDATKRASFALGGPDAKVIHAFESYSPVESLLVAHASDVFNRPDEHVGAARLRAFEHYPALQSPKKLSPKDSCSALNVAVTFLMKEIVARLSCFDRKALISHLLFLHETQVYDRHRWSTSARAVQALYGEADGRKAAQEADSIRSEVSVTLRVLIEASVCEARTSGGRSPDDFSVDELYGLMCALITLGRDSETIYHGLSTSGITIYPSGAYAFLGDVFQEIGVPYANQTFAAGYAKAAASYEDWVLPDEKEASAAKTDVFSDQEFTKAFCAEYHMEFLAFTNLVSAVIDRFIEREEVLLEFTRADLVELAATRSVAAADVDAFLDSFALPARDSWVPQAPTKAQDVEPWRFERRLSVMLRPIITCASGDTTYYVLGVGTLKGSVTYLLDSTVNGRFDKDVFTSKAMRSFIGKKVDEIGRAFTREVAFRLQELGWSTKEEVKMSALGAGKSPDLGDIDVLAWNSTGQVMAIECKRLKNARTVSEIAQSCARFAGREGDHLHKHLRRVAWLHENRDKVAKYLGIDVSILRIENPLVTNVEVPFAYVKDLPLPNDRIVPLSNFDDFVSNLFQDR